MLTPQALIVQWQTVHRFLRIYDEGHLACAGSVSTADQHHLHSRPISTDVLLEFVYITLSHLSAMCNTSIGGGSLPFNQEDAIITPMGLVADDVQSHQQISNLTLIHSEGDRANCCRTSEGISE